MFMERDFIISLIKFMDRIGANLNLEVDSMGIYNGYPMVCVKLEVFYKGEVSYLKHYCYQYKNKKVDFLESNLVTPIGDGILAYIGDKENVEKYFESLARTKAKNYLDSQYL